MTSVAIPIAVSLTRARVHFLDSRRIQISMASPRHCSRNCLISRQISSLKTAYIGICWQCPSQSEQSTVRNFLFCSYGGETWLHGYVLLRCQCGKIHPGATVSAIAGHGLTRVYILQVGKGRAPPGCTFARLASRRIFNTSKSQPP